MTYRQKTNVRRIKFAREAGSVRRLHVHRIIGEYDIAQHTYGALCLLRLLHPNPTIALTWAVLSHDKPERLTGDIPAPAKWQGGWFDRTQYADLEDEILRGTGFKWDDLSLEEELWLTFVDSCEFYLFCLDQEMMGNKTLSRTKQLIFRYVDDQIRNFPPECQDFWRDLMTEGWSMCEEIGEQDGRL